MTTPSRPILVDVDTQIDFMTPVGALYVPGADRLVPTLRRLVDLTRAQGLPHLATADTHTIDDPEFAAFGFPPHCVKGTVGWLQIPATRQLAPLTVTDAAMDVTSHRELRFLKSTFDIFSNPLFEKALVRLAPTEAIVLGVATDYCVKAAVLGLRRLGLPVLLVTDAIAGVTEAGAQAAIAEMVAAGTTMVTTEQIAARMANRTREVSHVA